MHSKYQYDLETVDRRATLWNTLKFPIIIIIIFIIIIIIIIIIIMKQEFLFKK